MPHRSAPPRLRFMSWVGYAWQRFLKTRRLKVPADLSDFRCPSQPGLVSIVLPVFNGADTLREALDSILAQTWTNFELILVDDGSTDATPGIIEDYVRRDGRIRAIRQANQKLPAALNTGFAAARGQFLTWTSADNNLRPDFLARLAADLEARPAVDMIYADYEIIDGSGRPLAGSDWCRPFQDPPGSARLRLLDDVSILNQVDGNYVGAAFLYRDRVAALVGPYDTRKFSYEDYDFFMRVNASLTLRHTAFDNPVYQYRIHGDSLSAREKEFSRAQKTRELVLFDAFRRDLFNTPLVWFIEGGAAPAAALRRECESAGDLVADLAAPWAAQLPPLFSPSVYVHFADSLDPLPSPPPSLPPHCLRVLVAAGIPELPRTVDAEWDFCIALSDTVALPRLSGADRGWFGCSRLATLRGAAVVRALGRQVAAVEEAAAAPESGTMKASVVICTCDRSGPLASAIRSACEQEMKGDDFEVIVVNNRPAQDLNPLVESLRKEFFPENPERLRLVACPQRGLAFARNAGLGAARGAIVAYLDDDAMARPGWLSALLAAYAADPGLGVLGGPALVQTPRPAPAWFTPDLLKYWSHFQPAATALTRVEEWTAFPYGANWSARRDLLLRVGGFRAGYGRGGARCDAGEELLAALQIQRLGAAVGVEPAAIVDHAVHPGRFTLPNLWRSVRDGWMLKFRLEEDLFLPPSLRVVDLVWHAVKRLGRAALGRGLRRPQRLEHALYAAAALRLAAACVRARRERLARPLFRD